MKKLLWIAPAAFLLVFYFLNIYEFLNDSHPVKANMLVVEGWLPANMLEKAATEFNKGNYEFIATTGIPFLPEFRMPYNGYLNFNFSQKPILHNRKQPSSIIIKAYGTAVENQFAKLNVLINDSLVYSKSTDAEPNEFRFEIISDTIFNVSVLFDNDAIKNGEDRDLFIQYISINDKQYLPRSRNVTYDRGKKGGDDIFSANFSSLAEEAALLLKRIGIPESKIIAVPTTQREINRTYNSALAFGDWLENYNEKEKIQGINVVSMGTHSRRSWILFKQNIKAEIPVGIISFKSQFTPDENWWKSPKEIKAVLTESVKYVYTLIFL